MCPDGTGTRRRGEPPTSWERRRERTSGSLPTSQHSRRDQGVVCHVETGLQNGGMGSNVGQGPRERRRRARDMSAFRGVLVVSSTSFPIDWRIPTRVCGNGEAVCFGSWRYSSGTTRVADRVDSGYYRGSISDCQRGRLRIVDIGPEIEGRTWVFSSGTSPVFYLYPYNNYHLVFYGHSFLSY